MPLDYPPTIIVVHPRENPRKCSVQSLRTNSNFVFWTFPQQGAQPLDGYVRLGIGGPLLSPDDASRGLLVLDGTWRLAQRMEATYAHLPVRSLPEWETAYPRVSKVFSDPTSGLATIEAIYAAFVMQGRDPAGLLDHYYWADQFLQKNQQFIQSVQAAKS